MNKLKIQQHYCLTPHKRNFKIQKLNYSLKFSTIIIPGTLTKLSLLNNTALEKTKHSKLFVKQSYLLLVWLMYIQGTYSELNENQKTPSFFIHKKQQTKTTKLKAPMAHKTFSQEQFLLKYYTLSISFKTEFNATQKLSSVNSSIFTALALRQNAPFFNTNLLFLKYIKFSYAVFDKNYMLLK